MDNTTPFPFGFPLYELPDLTNDVFFAFHRGINKLIYLNAAFESVWNISRDTIGSDLSLLFASVHPDDKLHVEDSFATLLKDGQSLELEFRIIIPPPRCKNG